ncbi:5-hydroxytryptamine receptor 3A-like [Synchiropus splendidus]|uniref:5-hydroxytryptamine receptor 3A-like n=1 Tax=Synchiropus splendidus TaxID=270530 RepID=UPI00237E2542|nr:5-hydroxytryptamine receptor 3A-like [Synchiropus splendidus]
MVRVAFVVLVFAGSVMSKNKCSYHEIVDHLNLTRDTSKFRVTRPVTDHTHVTEVQLDILLYAILAVVEKSQLFVSLLWATMIWNNEHISWDPAQFCGITKFTVTENLLWKPDLYIMEMTQKEDSPLTPFLMISYDGTVISERPVKVISTCEMDIYKFPFDIQTCNITIGSNQHSNDQLRLLPFSNTSRATQFSKLVMRTQGEWDFIQLSVEKMNVSISELEWEQLNYSFTVKRRPLLHVINFLVPILFFLCLDLSSYLISELRGEKLGFKVTVLLAISVLLLILNDILPSMSNKTPLIATYCITIFALMLLSLLVTIVVTYLTEKDAEWREKGPSRSWHPDMMKNSEKSSGCQNMCGRNWRDKEHGQLPATEEVQVNKEESLLVQILQELKQLQQMVDVHISYRAEGGKFLRWAKRINQGFFIFYIITVSVFLALIYIEWRS